MNPHEAYLAERDKRRSEDAAVLIELGFVPVVEEDLSVSGYTWQVPHSSYRMEVHATDDNYFWSMMLNYHGARATGGAFFVLIDGKLRRALEAAINAAEALQHLYFMSGTPPYVTGAHLMLTSRKVTIYGTLRPAKADCAFSDSVSKKQRQLMRRCASDVVKLGKYWW